MNLIEFESQLAKIGKCFYVFSHSDALQRYVEIEPDAEFAERDFGEFFRAREEGEKDGLYLLDFKKWAARYTGVRYHCVEICDACDVLTCTNKKHLHEWGAFGFGCTLQDAFVQVIGEMNRYHKINFAHLATEIPDLRSKVRFWNNAWHEQRARISGCSRTLWRKPMGDVSISFRAESQFSTIQLTYDNDDTERDFMLRAHINGRDDDSSTQEFPLTEAQLHKLKEHINGLLEAKKKYGLAQGYGIVPR